MVYLCLQEKKKKKKKKNNTITLHITPPVGHTLRVSHIPSVHNISGGGTGVCGCAVVPLCGCAPVRIVSIQQ